MIFIILFGLILNALGFLTWFLASKHEKNRSFSADNAASHHSQFPPSDPFTSTEEEEYDSYEEEEEVDFFSDSHSRTPGFHVDKDSTEERETYQDFDLYEESLRSSDYEDPASPANPLSTSSFASPYDEEEEDVETSIEKRLELLSKEVDFKLQDQYGYQFSEKNEEPADASLSFTRQSSNVVNNDSLVGKDDIPEDTSADILSDEKMINDILSRADNTKIEYDYSPEPPLEVDSEKTTRRKNRSFDSELGSLSTSSTHTVNKYYENSDLEAIEEDDYDNVNNLYSDVSELYGKDNPK